MIQFKVGTDVIRHLDFTPQGDQIAVQEGDIDATALVHWWDWQSGKEVRKWQVKDDVVFSPDHSRIAISGYFYDREAVLLYDGKTLKRTGSFVTVSSALVVRFTFAAHNQRLLVATRQAEVFSWDLPKKKSLEQLPHSIEATAVAVSPSGKRMAASGSDGQIWSWTAGDMTAASSFAPKAGKHIFHMIFADDDTLAIAVKGVVICDVASRKMIAPLKGLTHQVNGLALSPDGRLLATASNDGTVRFWDTRSWKERQSYDWKIKAVQSVAFAPDGLTCAAGGPKGQVVVWDVEA